MSMKRMMAFTLAASMTLGTAPAMVTLAAQGGGRVLGRATDEAKKPFTDYSVLLRDVASGQVVTTMPLDAQGLFTFNNVDLSRKFQIELFRIKDNTVVCTEGPYTLSSKRTTQSVNINCGNKAAPWLVAASAGAVGAVVLAEKSKKK